MKVLNVHQRVLNQPKSKLQPLFSSLATPEDQIWPLGKWPRMKFKDGLKEGAAGKHGPIHYTVERFVPGQLIEFKFTSPRGFHGFHKLELRGLQGDRTELKHTIDMRTTGTGTFVWAIAVKWLHDALMEDAFDRVENRFSLTPKYTQWNPWVRFLRWVFK